VIRASKSPLRRCNVRMMRSGPGKTSIRQPAVAGLFYPDDAAELRQTILRYLHQASVIDLPVVKAAIVPHAGYVYSGPIAAAAYVLLAMRRESIRRVVLIGPSHRIYLRGLAVPSANAFVTPLGEIPIDGELKALLLRRGDVVESDAPHAMEHCLEVQLPFLQTILDEFTLLPLVIGAASPQQVASVLEEIWSDEETLVLASSDLSHYHAYEVAQRIDAATSDAILRYDTDLSGDQACGAVAINGLLHLVRRRGLQVTQIARCSSGDTAGDRDRVVGYGAFAIHEPRHHTAS
ncbi:MAG: AmmeMemoRadiSam system protein B, partial [Burkholderiaceae bacterium]